MSEIESIKASLERIEQLALLGAKNVLNIDDVVVLTGYSKSHIYRLTSARDIPHYKQGKECFFKRSEVEDWLTQTKVKTNYDINQQADNICRGRARYKGTLAQGV